MIDPKTLWTIIHIFGVVFGAGGAFVSDVMFFQTIRDKKISHTEMTFLSVGSRIAWIGAITLLISGLGIFSQSPDMYLASSKFLLKMTVVLVIFINGLLFQTVHLPRMRQSVGLMLSQKSTLIKHGRSVVASGAISGWSWSLALILGVLPSIPLSTGIAVSLYIGSTAAAVLFAIILKDIILKV